MNYQDSLKSLDTEEHIDLAFYRPIGYMWACLAAKLGVTPNAITIASIFLGIAAGVAFYFNNMWINVAGMILLMWANSFDSADGQLARMTKQYSRLGRILDGMAGDLWFASIYVAICLRENYTSEFFMARPWLIWVIAVVAGLCHAKQAPWPTTIASSTSTSSKARTVRNSTARVNSPAATAARLRRRRGSSA